MIKDDVVSGKVSIGRLGFYLHAVTKDGYHIDFNFINSPELRTVGVCNLTKDQRFVMFMDFDRITYEKLQAQLDFIHEEYDVSHFLVLTTGKDRYHVISFEKFLKGDLVDALKNTFCDYTYKNFVPLKVDKGWILRIGDKKDLDGNVVKEKPEYFGVHSYSEVPKRKLSRAHIEFFAKLYPEFRKFAIEKLDEIYWDEYTQIQILRYGTSHENLIAKFDLQDLISSKKLEIIWKDDVMHEKNVS